MASLSHAVSAVLLVVSGAVFVTDAQGAPTASVTKQVLVESQSDVLVSV